MITKDNLKEVLIALNYYEKEESYIYYFQEFDCYIEVDFKNEKIIYPEDKGLIINERQTCNFYDNENFVVLECIHSLLLKGYKPAHIELERRWSLGHLQKSGRADICVMNETGNDLLFIIECKTYGSEFEKELQILQDDGGQLFSYYQQDKSTKWLVLYATGFTNTKITHQINTLPVFDTEEMIEKATRNHNILLFQDSPSKEKAFEVWSETYGKRLFGDLIFSKDTIAYNIGEKPLRKKDLKEFNPRDKIVNKFAEILRHNNVSDKENAFNKLVALFICKLVDEITKEDEDIVEFQYKFGTDTYETLLDRLQRLYKEGMDTFMKEEIFYVSSEYPLNLFSSYKGQNRKNAIKDLKETFRKLKFYSNSDFAFKDVHNEELFLQNGKILVEVVKLFENYRIVYPSKHQFLGDLFEQLLNQGFKQNEGQFFTPIPITRFIWESLPVSEYMKKEKNSKYPKVIDYACGSGHFLTEGIEVINETLGNSNNNWVATHIYGIEKDYRLARVSKIQLFMNGAGEGNIIFGDGLDNDHSKGIEDNSFDILVANPPYSVKAFKSHLNIKNNEFELLDIISNDGGEIEALFIERISQLIKANGIAAVILPSSILNNSSSIYTASRELILKNFKIKAIAQFGDKTFGATGTNTVIIFLEKYNEPPKFFEMITDSVLAIFSNQKASEWIDHEVLNDYLEHIGVDIEFYMEFIEESINYQEYTNNEYFKMYYNAFIDSKEYKNSISRNSFKKIKEQDQIAKINSLFYEYVKEIERDKLFYFGLVREETTLVIKSPSTATGQYEFLGYKWSNRKGSEGIQIDAMGGKLYDPNNKESETHIAPIIRKNYNDEIIRIDDSLSEYVSIIETKYMFDFERERFDKSISLAQKSLTPIKSKYDLEPLGAVCNVLIGGTPSRGNNDYFKGENLWVSIAELNGQVIKYTKEKITDEAIKNSNVKKIPRGTTLLSFKLSIGKVAIAGQDLYTNEAIAGLVPLGNRVLDKYLYFVFKSKIINLEDYIGDKAFGKSLNSTILKNNVKIPVPPISVQQSIVQECMKVENTYDLTRKKIEEYQLQIQHIFKELEAEEKTQKRYRLSEKEFFTIGIGKRVIKPQLVDKGIPVYSANVMDKIGFIEKELITDFKEEYIIWGIDGDWMVNILPKGYRFYPTDHCGTMIVNSKFINPRYMAYLLEKEGNRLGFSRSYRASLDRIGSINIKVPNINLQNEKMEEVIKKEKEIKELEKNQNQLNEDIRNILLEYW